jgi:hypothetical protein
MCGVKTKKPTSEYLKDLHTDAVCFYKPTLMMAYNFFGADRIVMGSDFPLPIGDLEALFPVEMDISGRKRKFGKNVQDSKLNTRSFVSLSTEYSEKKMPRRAVANDE